jgi:hypothetical protein
MPRATVIIRGHPDPGARLSAMRWPMPTLMDSGGSQAVTDAEQSDRQIAAERLSRVLGIHGVVAPGKPLLSYALIGLLMGAGIGLFLGRLSGPDTCLRPRLT